jgi:hypothetical protein
MQTVTFGPGDLDAQGIETEETIQVAFETETHFEDHGLPGGKGEYHTEILSVEFNVDGVHIPDQEFVARFGARCTGIIVTEAEKYLEFGE